MDINKIQSMADKLKEELGQNSSIFHEFTNKFFFEQVSKSFQNLKKKLRS